MISMKKVNLSDWILFSARRNSDNYISKDGKWLLKASSQMRQFDLEEILSSCAEYKQFVKSNCQLTN